jgi:two-component system, response regulator PdtaR
MFSEASILIAEDNLYLSLDLSSTVEEMGGRVIGPASSVPEALTLLARNEIAAAVIDFQLGDHDATVLALQLRVRRVPFVIHTAFPLPAPIAELHPQVPVLIKPQQCQAVLACLLDEMGKAGAASAAAPRPALGFGH